MTIAQHIAKKMTSAPYTLCTAESCTGGLIAKILTDIPGSSVYFKAGFIVYANEAKQRFLNVPLRTLKTYGAVSLPVAQAMAKGARKAAQCDFAVATTGIAGPGGGSPGKPVGLVYIAVASSRKVTAKRLLLKGPRQQIRTATAQHALKLLLREISSR